MHLHRPTTRIVLVRHGQSVANAGFATADDSAIPLTVLGQQQAQNFAECFVAPPAHVAVSPFLRARQTAGPLLTRFPAIPVEEWPIQEFHYLDLDGSKLTDRERRPYALDYWQRCDPAYHHGDGAESFSGFLQRTRHTIQRLSGKSEGGCHILFTHGFWMQAFRLLLLFPEATDLDLMANFRRFHSVNEIRNLEPLEFEAVAGHIRPVGQEHLNNFALQEPFHE